VSSTTTALAWLGGAANRTLVLPLVVFFPTSRCNSRCLSCEWWASSGRDDLSLREINELAEGLARLGTRLVVFSGGEPLLRPDMPEIADVFLRRGMKLHLLTSGVGLAPRAADVAARFERVVVSLDAATERLYAHIRGIDGLEALERGVERLRAETPRMPITARSTIHRANFRQLPLLAAKARAMHLSGISFLAADVTSQAFGRAVPGGPADLLLTREEIKELRVVIDAFIKEDSQAFTSGFVAESPGKLRRLAQHYAAMLGDEPFPARTCDAPWVSSVIEANGDVRPCFFHAPLGNLREEPLASLVRGHLRAFRSSLNVGADRTCETCVCSLNVDWSRAPWN
jgi:MoaA/NifB/PqqE/SkfB family radical SAM enzyme